MIKNNKSTLIIEDDILLAGHCQAVLKTDGWQVETVETGAKGWQHLIDTPPHVLLLDIFLPDMHGIKILNKIQQERMPTEVVVMTGKGSIDMAVEAMRLGAYDFFSKPLEDNRLLTTMNNAMRHWKITQKIQEYEKTTKRNRSHNLIGSSLPMQTLFRIIDSVASSRASVFITGESGTGKELCAQAIHQQSPRRHKPFVTINCAAIPHDLMESEIFGHVKGAFSDAQHHRGGAASQANGGTLFLDEICEMELGLQSKLLRFLQSGHVKKVGSDREEAVDVRIICATNKDPLVQVKQGTFREDLFYRLYVVPVPIPPLRHRGDDVLLLAQRFLRHYAKEEGKSFTGFSSQAAAALLNYPWPGNVRELQNIIQQTVVLHEGEKITPAILPPPLNILPSRPFPCLKEETLSPFPSPDETPLLPAQDDETAIIPLLQVEMKAIERAIQLCGGNIQQAAQRLEINPSTVYRRLKKWHPHQM